MSAAPATTAKTIRPATAANFRALHAFIEALDALDWREGVERHEACRQGSRLCELGWLRLERGVLRSGGASIMGGKYFPAEYKLTPAGKAAAEAHPAVAK